MAQLDNAYTDTISVSKGSVITLATQGTYIPNNIALTVTMNDATLSFTGGALNGKTASAEFKNIVTSSTNNGIEIFTKGTAGRAAVSYTNTAGWLDAHNTAQSASGSVSASTWDGTKYYITKITVPKSTNFELVTEGNTTTDNSILTLTNNAYRKINMSNSGTAVITSGSNTAGTLQVAAYSSNSDSNTPVTQTIVTNGVWETNSINPSTSAQGPYYGKTSVTAVSKSDNLIAGNIKTGQTVVIKGGNSNIWSIEGTYTSDATVTSNSQILSGYIAYSKGTKYTGSMANNGALNGTINTQGGTYTIPAGYTTGGTITATLPTTSVSTPTWTKNSSTKIVTTSNSQWNIGYIESAGNLPAATFSNSVANPNNYLDLSDGKKDSSTMIIPEIPSGGKLYISRGYIDNVCISLGRLIPDADASAGIAANYILEGHSAYDVEGNLIVGTITAQTWPTTISTSAASGYTSQATAYALTTTDQYINITAGFYGSNAYYKINKLTSSNYSAANIKYNTTISVNNGNDDVYSVTGTFTATPSGKNALTAAALRSGYAGFINGNQVNGSMPDVNDVTPIATITNIDTYFDSGTPTSNSITITPSYTNATAGYLAAHSSAQNGTITYKTIKVATFTGNGGNVALVADTTSNSIYQSSTSTGNVSIESSAPAANSGYMYIKLTGSGSVKTTTDGAGWINANTATNVSGSSTKFLKILKYDGSYTVT